MDQPVQDNNASSTNPQNGPIFTPNPEATQPSTDSTTAPQSPPQQNSDPVNIVTSEPPQSGNGNGKKAIFAIAGITVLITGLVTGVFLIGRTNLRKSSAWDCSGYTFKLEKTGEVIASNLSAYNEPPQQARVIINSQEVAVFDVPALASGDTASLGNVQPPTGSYSWEIVGTVDCSNSGSHEQEITARCEIIKAYDTEGNLLNLDELSALPGGSTVRFTVLGSTSEGIFDKAKFIINDSPQEVTNKNESGEFYIDYQIPEGTNTIKVDAQVHHSTLDNWY